MTPAARLQAAIEILDEVIASARDDGPPADAIVTRYFKQRRYAGSKDRRAVRELVFRAIRRSAERPESGRAAMLGLPRTSRSCWNVRSAARARAAGATKKRRRRGLRSRLARSRAVAARRRGRMAGAARARAARPARQCVRGHRATSCSAQFRGGEPTPISPWGIRLPPDSRVEDHPAFAAGLVEVQDEGSQLIALACEPADERADPRSVRRRRRQGAGAGRRGSGRATILATDSNRARLSKLAPRAERAGARRSKPGCSIRRANSTSWPTGGRRPTSCWSMRHARAAAPGAAIPRGAGA